MSLRFLLLVLGIPFITSAVSAQDAPSDPAPHDEAPSSGPGTSDPGAPSASDPGGASSSSTSSSSNTTGASGSSSTANASGASGAAPGSTFREPEPAPVIHPPVGTSSPLPPPPVREEDEGRSNLLWLEAGFGYSWANLAAFSNNNFVPGVEQFAGSGYAGHVAAGFQVFLFTIGARGTVASYPGADTSFDLWSLMLDVMLKIPIGFAEPYFRVGFGYAWMGQLDVRALGTSTVSVYGLAIEGGAGIDLYLSDRVSLGAGFDLAFLNLTRQRLDGCTDVGGAMCNVGGVDFQEEGDAAGFQVRATGHIAFHF